MVEAVTLNVEGMSCQHCVEAIEGNVRDLGGVNEVKVNLQQGTVDVDFQAAFVTLSEIRAKIEEQGYKIK
ncbi:copper chaperone CopZ [Jeotgalibacillus campisalis]|uniref:Copper chaperone CopZ n=1 Tax=Jeotgalibacillus campisalis TaxID=220754 RepID=A0A0C2REQ8_9BACL|nr:copper chaperone CopZ [Jeotgalibacillus campisalis]KIL48735.1 copper chaperone copper-ion-binding protein CopZ [Jeotgalibacillus campisalis]